MCRYIICLCCIDKCGSVKKFVNGKVKIDKFSSKIFTAIFQYLKKQFLRILSQ